MHSDTDNSADWTRPVRTAASMDRSELLAELERMRHELAEYRADAQAHADQLAQTRAMVEASRDHYADLYDLAPVGFVTLDRTGVMTDINLIGAEMLGAPRKWLIDRPLLGYVAASERRKLLGHTRRCRYASAELVTDELWLAPQGGEPIHAQLISRPVRVEGHGTYYRTAMIDQTQRYQAQQAVHEREAELQKLNEDLRRRTTEAEGRSEQLRAMAAELSQAEQRERQKLAQVLHDDLQQMLVGVKAQIGMLKQREADALPDAVDQLIEYVNEAVQSTRTLSHELSPRVLYESGLAAALQWLASREEEKYGLRLRVKADESAEPAGEDVKVLLFQSVRELLLNAIKHAQVDEARVTMRVSGEDQLCITVSDDGPGFDPERLRREAEAGQHVGLFGVDERLKALGGEMAIDSASGQGTSIRLYAPLYNTAASADPASDGPGEGREESKGPEPASGPADRPEARSEDEKPRSRPIRVLLVDDHKLVRQGLVQLIELEHNIEVIAEAADGQQAHEQAQQHRPDVVVMDITMPNMNGVEATKRILQSLPQTKVIALSMHEADGMAKTMRDAGACDYVTKDRAAEELIEAVRRCVRGEMT